VPVAPVVGAHGDPAPLEVRRPVQLPERQRLVHDVAEAGGVEDRPHLLGRERVERPLLAVAVLVEGVGVLGRGDAAAVEAQVAQHVAHGLLHHLPVAVVPGHLQPVQVQAHQPRLVVEHLLEVGDHPVRVDRVPGEPAAQVVVHAARRHGVERRLGHRRQLGGAGVDEPAEHEVEVLGGGELRGTTEAAPLVVVDLVERVQGLLEHLEAHDLVAGGEAAALAEGLGEPVGLLEELVALGRPGVGHRLEQLGERRHAATGSGREVGAPVEGTAVRGEEHGHRPAAPAGHRLHGVHVDGVDVGSLLPVDLHVHEVLVHDRCGGLVLEGLVRHDVAPVAGRVADAQQDRDVSPLGLGHGLRAPRPPVDRVVGVLAQVRARLVGEAVHAEGGRLRPKGRCCR
jgi:hypothetical protein